MKPRKNQGIFFSMVLFIFILLHLPALNLDTIMDKQFGIEEEYTSSFDDLQAVMPILADGMLEDGLWAVYQLNWHLDTNSFTQERIFPFTILAHRCFDNLKWNGEMVLFPTAFLEDIEPESAIALYEETDALDGDLSVTIASIGEQQYQLQTGEATYVVRLPGFYCALAGAELEHTIFVLFLAENRERLPVRYELKILEISKEIGATQICNVTNVPSSLTEFLYTSADFVRTKSGCVWSFNAADCMLVDGMLFLHDRKSVYKIDLEKKICKRVFSIIRSIPQTMKERYSDIVNTDIYQMGYYQGLFCLNLLAEEGVGNDYFYIPFIENPVVYCRGTEDVSTDYLFPSGAITESAPEAQVRNIS